MNTFVNAMTRGQKKAAVTNAPLAQTHNGATTLSTSGDASLDLFAIIGSATNEADIISLFKKAHLENPDLAGRVSLWSRDIRGGAGRRLGYRAILRYLEVNDFDMFCRLAVKTPELGRWDDLLVAQTEQGKEVVFRMIAKALSEKNGLCAKWMPRKGETARELREYLGLTPKQYRKVLVSLSQTVEQQMCAKQFSEINYSHVPSVAGARYAKAFRKHDAERYQTWLDSLSKDGNSEVKINTATLYPYDVVRALNNQGEAWAQAAWENLPEYFDSEQKRILPIIDTSGSMTSFMYYGAKSSMARAATSPMQIATSLGIYVAERNKGPFKNCVIPFSDRARFVQFKDSDTLSRKIHKVTTGEVASTNIQAAFKLILDTAVKNKVNPEDMPTHLLIISDMEFNQAVVSYDPDERYLSRRRSENFAAMDQMYRAAGYDRPTIIFWNVNGREGNNPVEFDEANTAMVSGFSPAIVKAALNSQQVNPLDAMMDTVMNERYNF